MSRARRPPSLIRDEGVALEAVAVGGEIRSTSVILEPGRATVLNEPGPPLADGDWEALEAAVDARVRRPPRARLLGQPAAREPGRRLRAARPRPAVAVVDAGGAVLGAALEAGPAVVTPNLAEAEGLLHGRADEAVEASPDARGHAEAAASALVSAGARAAVVTAAAAGAAVAADGAVTWLVAPRVSVVNPIGAGDVFTAALAGALEAGDDVLERRAARRGGGRGERRVVACR